MQKDKPQKSNDVVFTIFIIFLILLLCALSLFASSRLRIGERSNYLGNGSGIYKSLFAEISQNENQTIDLPLSTPNSETTQSVFTNSTDYLAHLVVTDIIPVNWSYFKGPDIPSALGKYDKNDPISSIADFKAENNMWSVVADLNPDDTSAPFLISCNLQADQLQSIGKLKLEGPPYGKKQIVVIRMGGSGQIIKGRDLTWENLNPTGLDNKILRP